jgi:hypothetical protein
LGVSLKGCGAGPNSYIGCSRMQPTVSIILQLTALKLLVEVVSTSGQERGVCEGRGGRDGKNE